MEKTTSKKNNLLFISNFSEGKLCMKKKKSKDCRAAKNNTDLAQNKTVSEEELTEI
jgi:hypothetical protein